ncbi:MAG: hypothetical protein EOP09_04395 [Proteobacteria bacterium]|nr:MAG: hypothetical protein EOP09_04395 [Pseudomonadota bacterium]
MNCVQCKTALACSTSPDGMISECQKCQLTILSVGRLLQASDRRKVASLWSYVTEVENFEPAQRDCPCCQKPLIRFDLSIENQRHRVVACKSCYTCILRNQTHRAFLATHPAAQEKRLLQAYQKRVEAQNLELEKIDRAVGTLFQDVHGSLSRFQDSLPPQIKRLAQLLGFCALMHFFGIPIALGIVFGFMVAGRVFEGRVTITEDAVCAEKQIGSKPHDIFVSQSAGAQGVQVRSARHPTTQKAA